MDKVKVLFLAANPTSTARLSLDKEIRSITEKIRASRYRDALQLESGWAVRPDDLLQLLNEHKPHIVHFSGHGSQTGEIILVDNRGLSKSVSTQALKALFKTLKDNIQVVVLNACYSQSQAEAITEIIDCTIGMNDAIGDQAAITFAASFYRAIGFGRSVQEAFDQGKVTLLLEGIPEETTPELLVKPGINPSQLFLIKEQIDGEQESSLKTITKPTSKHLSNQPIIAVQPPKPEAANPVATANTKKATHPPSSLNTPLCIYQNHSGTVYAVAWSPDGTHIASGGNDHTVQVWDTSNGHKMFSYRGHLEVYALVWSPNSFRVFSGGREGEIQEWDTSGKRKLSTYQGHSDAIYALAFSPDGARFASASWDRTVRVWDVATRRDILTYKGHSDWVKTLCWSPDSSSVVSGGSDKTVQVWNATTGHNFFTYHSHGNIVNAIAWSPDGTRIASGSWDKTVQVWDIATGHLIFTYGGHFYSVNAVAWSPDGTRMASASDDSTVQVWQAVKDESKSYHVASDAGEPVNEKPSTQSSEPGVNRHGSIPDLEALKKQFNEEMWRVYYEAQAIGPGFDSDRYYFLLKKHKGREVELAQDMLKSNKPTYKYAIRKLRAINRLDLTVEALALKPAYASFFTEDERKEARRRLEEDD